MYAYLARFSAVALQSVEAGYARVPLSVDETARMLGARPWRLFVQLHAPLLRRSALAAALLVFVDVMKELPATLVLRPFGSDTLAVVAFNLARDEAPGRGRAAVAGHRRGGADSGHDAGPSKAGRPRPLRPKPNRHVCRSSGRWRARPACAARTSAWCFRCGPNTARSSVP
jgi:hypothetical protein